MLSEKSESPVDEMKRLLRTIAARVPGSEAHRIRFAAGKIGVVEGRAKALWYGEIKAKNISSEEMDRARELAALQPIEEALHAIQAAERWIDTIAEQSCTETARALLAHLQSRLAVRVGRSGEDRRDPRSANREGHQRRASDRSPHSTRVAPFDPARLKGFAKLTS